MKNSFKLTLLGLGTALLLNACGSNSNEKENPKKIEVTGSAEMEVVPDEIYMTFSFREYLDGNKQKVKIETIKTAFLKLCHSVGIPDSNVSIADYAGYERWDYYWYKNHKNQPDFMANMAYTVKVKGADQLDQIVAQVDDKGLQNYNITKTAYSKMEALRKEVKSKALLASKEKAQYLAASIGEDIGEALLIQEINNDGYGYSSNAIISNSNYSFKSDEAQAYIPSAQFEKIKIRYEMRAEYRLK